MSIADTCEESAFEHGRSVAIEGFTTKELVDELCKREEVRQLVSTEYHWYKVVIEHEDDHHSISGSGAARILVVK